MRNARDTVRECEIMYVTLISTGTIVTDMKTRPCFCGVSAFQMRKRECVKLISLVASRNRARRPAITGRNRTAKVRSETEEEQEPRGSIHRRATSAHGRENVAVSIESVNSVANLEQIFPDSIVTVLSKLIHCIHCLSITCY